MSLYLLHLLLQLSISTIALLALVLPVAICHMMVDITNFMRKGGKQDGFIQTTEITRK